MGLTKRQFIELAFDEIGFSDYVYNLSAAQLEAALRKMDAMVATWNALGLNISYALPTDQADSDLSTDSGVPDRANEAIILNLAIRLAPSFGKVPSPDTKINASMAYNAMFAVSAKPLQMQFPETLPSGQGNKPWRLVNDPFLFRPVDRLNKDLEWLTDGRDAYPST